MTNPPTPPAEGNAPPPSDDEFRPPQGSPPPPPPEGYSPPGAFPPPQGGYPPPPQGGFPPQSGYGPQGGYPPPGGYGAPPPQGGFPPQSGYGPQGGYPPPGGYGPPPQGGGYYPPPPQGNYPPPQGSYPPPQGNYPPYSPGGTGFSGRPEVNVGEGFSWAWNKFSKNVAAIIVPTLVYGVVLAVIYGITVFLASALAPESTSTYESGDSGFSYSATAGYGAASIVVLILGYLVLFVASGAVSSALYSGLLDIANGQSVEIGSFFKPRNVGSVLIASLLVGVAAFIGSILCIIPGLVVAIFSIFTTVMIVERNLSPIDGIKASFDLVKNNFVQALLTWLLVLVIAAVGVLACGIGVLVSSPVASLYLVFAYRRLTGGQVAPLTP